MAVGNLDQTKVELESVFQFEAFNVQFPSIFVSQQAQSI